MSADESCAPSIHTNSPLLKTETMLSEPHVERYPSPLAKGYWTSASELPPREGGHPYRRRHQVLHLPAPWRAGYHPHPRRCNSAGQALPMSTQRRSSAEILLEPQPRGPETIRYVATHCLGVLQQSWQKREVSSPRWYSFRGLCENLATFVEKPAADPVLLQSHRYSQNNFRNSVVQSRVRVRNERSRTRHLVLRAIEVDRDLELRGGRCPNYAPRNGGHACCGAKSCTSEPARKSFSRGSRGLFPTSRSAYRQMLVRCEPSSCSLGMRVHPRRPLRQHSPMRTPIENPLSPTLQRTRRGDAEHLVHRA